MRHTLQLTPVFQQMSVEMLSLCASQHVQHRHRPLCLSVSPCAFVQMLRGTQFSLSTSERDTPLSTSVKRVVSRDVGGWGRDPRKQKDFCTTVKKKTKTKNLMSVRRRCLLQLYECKVPVLHIIKYHELREW